MSNNVRSSFTSKPVSASASAPQLHPGAEPVPDYVLVEQLGRGGYGEVWKAKGPGGFDVALKFIGLAADGATVELRSLDLMKSIRHPHLVAMSGAWQRNFQLIIAMELGEGTLLDRLREAGAQGHAGIPRDELLEYMREAAKGIDHLNELGIQHRDIKPQNLLLVGGGVKVADFGLAKLLEHSTSLHSGSMTPAYAAPEFLDGKTSVNSDQYSLAISYCQMRGGQLPFTGTASRIVAGHLREPPDLTMLPVAEQAVVARALAKNPEERWPNCRAFVEALLGVSSAQAPQTLETPTTTTERPHETARMPVTEAFTPGTPERQSNTRWLRVGGVAAISLIALGIWWATYGRRGDGDRDPNPNPKDHRPVTKGNTGDGKKPRPSVRDMTNSIGMEFILVAPGKFFMGSPPTEANRDMDEVQHEVEITRTFYIGKYEVTQREYTRVMETNPSHFSRQRLGQDAGSFPVENVSWQDARDFCQKLSAMEQEKLVGRAYRLPTEAEWEYACRAGALTPFAFGDKLGADQANFDGRSPYGGAAKGENIQRTKPVGSYEPNSWGLFDMHGNVREWCEDYFGPYDLTAKQDPRGPRVGFPRIMRGGSWGGDGANCRAAERGRDNPAARTALIGFRVVCVSSSGMK